MEASAPVQAGRSRRILSPYAVLAALSLVASLTLSWLFNVLLLQNVRDVSPVFGFVLSIGYSGSGLFALTSMVTLVLKAAGTDVRWMQVVILYMVANLAHLISGVYALCVLWYQGVPSSGQPLYVSLNVFGWEGGIGRFLNRNSIDEVLHYALFGALLAATTRPRRPWWQYGLVLFPFFVGVLVMNAALSRVG